MMRKYESLPLLPGFNIDKKIGCERWHKSPQFDMLNGKIPYLAETKKPTISYPFPWDPAVYKYPSLYPRKEHGELASWIIYDKQILTFDAYFFDTFEPVSSLQRKVKIHFFLEDGTLQVNEKKIPNCGLSQGTIISRRRIPFPKPAQKSNYELVDLNIGKSLEFFGRVYHIYDCDKFTRQWLHRAGVPVPEAIPVDCNPKKLDCPCDLDVGKKKECRKLDKRGQFLMYDTHVLRFFGLWDDSESEGGYLRKLIIQYYLSDDTIDVREEDGNFMVARTKLPKFEARPQEPGESDFCPTLLNVLSTGYLKGRIVKDSKNAGATNLEYYTDGDLLPGVCVNVFGRAVMLTGCDAFTQDYYKKKYGIDNFENEARTRLTKQGLARPKVDKPVKRNLPPWNGFGSFEDSERNCLSLYPQGGHDGIKQLVKSRSALDSHILRFRARMLSNDRRDFVVSFYLMDDTTSVFEMAKNNPGFEHRMFIGRKEAFKPVGDYFVSRKPSTYQKEDFWVGNVLDIDGFKFELLEADEYCLRYMEINCQEFPKSNVDLILMKIGEKLRPVFKAFVKDYFMPYGEECVPIDCLKNALKTLLGDDITPHEIIVIARRFGVRKPKKCHDKETIKDICRSECRRFLFLGYERLAENLYQMDKNCTGYVSRIIAYNMCRGAKIPVEKDLLHAVVDVCESNSTGEVSIADLLTFFNPAINPSVSFAPFSHVDEFSDLAKLSVPQGDLIGIDTRELIRCLGLEEELKKEN